MGRRRSRSPASTSTRGSRAPRPAARTRSPRSSCTSRASSRASARCSSRSGSRTGRRGCASRSCTPRRAFLSDAFVAENFAFYGTQLTGVPVNRERWKRGVGLVEGALGEAIGKVYVERHFPPAAKDAMDELVANLIEAYRQIDRRPRVDERRDARARARQARRVHAEDRLPRAVAGLLRRSRSTPTTSSATSAARTSTSTTASSPSRPADRPRRVVHDPADGQRVLQPAHERDRVPRGDPAAPVLRRRPRRRRQLRRHRRGHRPRDRPRLRRPGQPLRRRRVAARLVDRCRPRGVRGAHRGAHRPVRRARAARALGRAHGQRRAHDRREHRRPRRARHRDQGVRAARCRAASRADAGRSTATPASSACCWLGADLAAEGPGCRDHPPADDRPALAERVPLQPDRPQHRRVLRGLRRHRADELWLDADQRVTIW